MVFVGNVVRAVYNIIARCNTMIEVSCVAKIWYPELWESIKIDLTKPETYYGQSETKSFYDYQDPNEGYEVRGIRPIYRNAMNTEHSFEE